MKKREQNFEKRLFSPQNRLKSPVFWTALTAQIVSALVLTGVVDSGSSEVLKNFACALLELMVTFGILNDPTNGASF